jgi:hypothetical protein
MDYSEDLLSEDYLTPVPDTDCVSSHGVLEDPKVGVIDSLTDTPIFIPPISREASSPSPFCPCR